MRPMKMVGVVVLSSHPPPKAHKQCVDVVTNYNDNPNLASSFICDHVASSSDHSAYNGRQKHGMVDKSNEVPGYLINRF